MVPSGIAWLDLDTKLDAEDCQEKLSVGAVAADIPRESPMSEHWAEWLAVGFQFGVLVGWIAAKRDSR